VSEIQIVRHCVDVASFIGVSMGVFDAIHLTTGP